MYGKTHLQKRDSCQLMLCYAQNCKAHESLTDQSMRRKGFAARSAALVFKKTPESVCTSLSYSREATEQEVTYWCGSVLVCRAVSSCAAASSLPRKLRSPLREEAGGAWTRGSWHWRPERTLVVLVKPKPSAHKSYIHSTKGQMLPFSNTPTAKRDQSRNISCKPRPERASIY